MDYVLATNQTLQIMTGASADAAHATSDGADPDVIGGRLIMINCQSASVQFVWTDLDASDATITVECTNIAGSWIPKSTATYTIPSGDGANSFSLNLIVTEKYYRVRYDPGTNTAGTIDCYIHGTTFGT